MALIYHYDATELDKQQISEALKDTDHHWEYIEDKISLENINPEAEVISVFVTSTVTREMIEKMPKLRLIACRSTGFNNVDFDACEERNITVTNVPTYGENTVAEYAFTLLLALTRNLKHVFVAENEQFDPHELMGTDLSGKTIGVIGTGHIGQKTIKIADGFSMNVIAYDAFPNEEIKSLLNFEYVDLDDLIQQADIISLHVPYLDSTHHIINERRLGLMKKGAILVNTARGELVDTKALVEALDSGHLGGAAIDVVEGEALLNHHEETALLRNHVLPEEVVRHSVEISALKKMPNVVISPHNAFNTIEAIHRINNTTVKNIVEFWYGSTPNKVKPAKKSPGKLLIVRHAESEWNATGKWTGRTDVHLSEKGFKEASMLGQLLKELDIKIDIAYCSEQIRSRETLEGMLNTSQQFEVEIQSNGAINERDYGEYTGKNKWEIKEQVGDEEFHRIRRGWDTEIPNGENLRMVYERAVPFYKDEIVPLIHEGKNVLMVAHGNSIRALMKYIDSISDEDVGNLEMLFGQIIVYDIDEDGKQTSSDVYEIETDEPKN